MLPFEHNLQSFNAQSSKQREIISFFKRLIGTTRHFSQVSDITNPKIYNPAPKNVIYRLSRQNMPINDEKITTHKLHKFINFLSPSLSDFWLKQKTKISGHKLL